METEDQEPDYSAENLYRQEFELLKGMFEDHFSSDVISGVLDDCGGDVNLALDTLTKIESCAAESAAILPLETPTQEECNTNEVTECHNNYMATTNINMNLQPHSYASASGAPVTSTGATSYAKSTQQNQAVRNPPRVKNIMPKVDYWTDQMKKIITDYNEGNRLMVVMRGAPGCGKSYLARVIVESTVGTMNPNSYTQHIFSSDDHMEINGRYQYNVNRLGEVHMKNQTRVHKAVCDGRSPVIVDNTNMQTWEMYAYVRDGVMNGYIIEVLEPSNPWAKTPSQLAKRNIHGVPKEKIELMFKKYEGSHTGESLLKYFKLSYPKGMEPPLKRNIPPFYKKTPTLLPPKKLESLTKPCVNPALQINSVSPRTQQVVGETQNGVSNINKTFNNSNVNNVSNLVGTSQPINKINKQQNIITENKLDEMLKVEVEWDNNDGWETPLTNRETRADTATLLDPKPQRSKANEISNEYIKPSMLHDDWTQNLTFKTPLHNDTASARKEPSLNEVPCDNLVEIDGFIKQGNESIIGMSSNVSGIPNQNNTTVTNTTLNGRCVHEEKHFVRLRKMFKNIPRAVLRDIFDNCAGDVDWACTIVLDGIQNNDLKTVNAEESDSEEEEEVDCQCQCDQPRENNIVPDTTTEPMSPLEGENALATSTQFSKKKSKKDKILTEDTFLLKKQIEHTVTISDHHYSQHYLNLRRYRSDNTCAKNEEASTSVENSDLDLAVAQNTDLDEPINCPSLPESSLVVYAPPGTEQSNQNNPSTSREISVAVPSTSGTNNFESTEDDDDYEFDDEIDSDDDKSGVRKHLTVNIGMEFVRKLDELNNRHDFEYPEGVEPTISIPIKLLNDINALWIESITYQLDQVYRQTEEMIKQDEEFARQLELELQLEAEETESSSEEACALEQGPETRDPSHEPNFKEIMDTELALAIYERSVKEEWKNREPQDMAAQMTRKKLYELFPDVGQDTLSEMLIAHENSFDNTVETLLMSTGQGHYLEHTNGINNFVIEKEKANREQLMLRERNAALDEEEYPYLIKPGKDQPEVNMVMVKQMRDKADAHKNARDTYFRKAQWYYQRKKLSEASYFSSLAALHTSRYDKASNFAAAALVQCHAKLHPGTNVIDLHFLRVPEAETSLDLFIDDRLRQMRLSSYPRCMALNIITGRGKHSPGRPRVKPAIMKHLRARGIQFHQQNPGLLVARLKPTHLLLEELLNP